MLLSHVIQFSVIKQNVVHAKQQELNVVRLTRTRIKDQRLGGI